MAESQNESLRGATVNGSGTKIASAKAFGSGPAVDTTKPTLDHCTLVSHGNQLIPIKSAISQGFLRRNSSGVLEEMNGPQAATRTNS